MKKSREKPEKQKFQDPPHCFYDDSKNIVCTHDKGPIKSEIMTASIEKRYKQGCKLTPHSEICTSDSNALVTTEEEAKIAKSAFVFYSHGFSVQKIADALTDTEQLKKKGSKGWPLSSVLTILYHKWYYRHQFTEKT